MTLRVRPKDVSTKNETINKCVQSLFALVFSYSVTRAATANLRAGGDSEQHNENGQLWTLSIVYTCYQMVCI